MEPMLSQATNCEGRINEFDAADLKRLNFLLQKGYDLAYAIEQYHEVHFYEGMTLQDVAEQMAKEGGFDGVPDRMRHLINYDNILRHLKLRGYYETHAGVFFKGSPHLRNRQAA